MGVRTAISTYANNEYSKFMDNGWLLDIIEDLNYE